MRPVPMRPRLPLPALLLLLSACQGIPPASRDLARQELEVAIQIDPGIPRLLQEEEGSASLDEVVSEAVFSLADLGLRFYPVPSSGYGEGDERPAFLLSVRIRDFGAVLERGLVRTPRGSQPPHTEDIDDLRCGVTLTLYRRRSAGPPLLVGQASGTGESAVREASAQLSSMREFALDAEDSFGPAPRFKADDLSRSVRSAIESALGQMVEAVDRELARKERPVVR